MGRETTSYTETTYDFLDFLAEAAGCGPGGKWECTITDGERKVSYIAWNKEDAEAGASEKWNSE